MVILGPTENHNIKALRSDINIIRTSSVFLSLLSTCIRPVHVLLLLLLLLLS